MSRARLLDDRVIDDFLAFCDRLGIRLFDWQRESFGQATARVDGRFRYRLAGISVARGQGKSYGGAVVGLWRLLCGEAPQDIISAALDYEGAKVVLDHARRIIRGNAALSAAIEVREGALLVPATGSRWTVTGREHLSSRGRHATLACYDEIGWAKDEELFSSLLAGQASVADPLCLVISTVGRKQTGPLWTVRTLAEGGDPGVYWFHSSENLSPLVTQDFLERQRRILLPGQFAREHQNVWVDGADSFVTAAQVDRAMGTGWSEQPEGRYSQEHHAYVDLGLIHDPTVIAIGHLEPDGLVYIDRIVTFQGSREMPVRLQTIEESLQDLAKRFELVKVRIESWQGAASAQLLKRCGLPVELFTPTQKTNAEEWPILASRLAAGTLVLPPHAALRTELLNLVYEVGPSGIKVIDKGKVHQDHAVAVRGVVASLGTHAIGEVGAANLSARRTAHAIDPDDPGRPAEYWPGVGDFMGEPDYMTREDLGLSMRERLRRNLAE